MRQIHCLILLFLFIACSTKTTYDVIIRNGIVYDGSGSEGAKQDIGIVNDSILKIGDLSSESAKFEIDAHGLAVAPGFINTLSWASNSLIHDGNSQSDIRQGVTLEVFGEGWSEGPLNEKMKADYIENQSDYKFPVEWTTLGEYLETLEKSGISTNVASFVGATTVRIHEVGNDDRAPSPDELERMKQLVRTAMEEGALGLGTSLIYAPAFYAKTDELIELSKIVSEYNGMYISHMRSEGSQLLQALDELIRIAREANVPAEIYHLKAAGQANYHKLDDVIKHVEQARSDGLQITADMYTYTAGATGLDAAMPPWVQEGGYLAWSRRLQDPKIRKRLIKEMSTPTDEWENLYLAAGSPDRVILVGFRTEKLKALTGKTVAEIAEMRGSSPYETMMDLVIEDSSRVEAVYFMMSDENIKKKIKLPWMSFDSDAASLAPEGAFLKSNPHPRAYGSFARLLGKYVREENVISLGEAIRRLSSLPAENFKLKRRGRLKTGYFADVVIFDPNTIKDNATFANPHQYATGVVYVLVNGQIVLDNGEHTGAKAGRVVRGPGWRGWKNKS
ncbi:MAG: D-aminoacylase [Calditrichaeota bacterium]|nr:D-aminoacylase [Calditrichota bacterium]